MNSTLPLSANAARAALLGLVPGELDDGVVVERYARAVWSALCEPGDGDAGLLVGEVGAAAALGSVVTGDARGIAAAAGIDPARAQDALDRWRPRLAPGPLRAAFDTARRVTARLVVPGDARWPARMDDLGPHAPLALWVRGALPEQRGLAVAIVGARAATSYGEHVAMELAADLAGDGVRIVSGAAYGIDGAAHRAALAAGGHTDAFLAGGVDRPYPSGHEDLLRRVARSGAVISELPCGAAPTKWRFLARNRLIAALSDAVVVVEAGHRSGSLNTAGHAASLGRGLGAVPGPVTSPSSAGCHRLLREYDARCITDADDVRELLGMHDDRLPGAEEWIDEATALRDALSTRAWRPVDDIARRCGQSTTQVERGLGLLLLHGRAQHGPAGWRLVVTRR
ncbi:DNA-processing protein DprA [Microbacterium sp. zg.Y1090]|uniref:DNA-processing protein DprA n=1 Tax=Microbacterium TaxID=33882 RepID=UPI00214CCFE4|nr:MULTISPECIES: DNA-processing protein DprA [unclassified Microbacterium]MCR2811645.1 DNA-processing protein DprA [Microbacterium sp. zg.Y1084]MCR2818917.1 DNA-processing protein DprA [Microbacterium sp. zg.Y1090]MDL5487582.1 DNA-processing protein DprA [Microbacterium sp. zg-Y1211]WIM27224.1 DNA-processing protein DprA [Microbacterium sp. zg-Y1090]